MSLADGDFRGDGPAIVYRGTHASDPDLMWPEPGDADFLETLTRLGRLVTFDRGP